MPQFDLSPSFSAAAGLQHWGAGDNVRVPTRGRIVDLPAYWMRAEPNDWHVMFKNLIPLIVVPMAATWVPFGLFVFGDLVWEAIT